jgi:integrase
MRKLAHGLHLIWPDPDDAVPGASAFSYRRAQLGARPLVALFKQVCQPTATPQTRGAFLFGLRLMASDGTTADVPDTPRLGPPELRSLEPAEVRRPLRAAQAHVRDYAILEVLLGTGIRVGELLHLQVGDVTVRDRSGRLIVRAGKRNTYRELPLSRDVRHALLAYLERTHPDAPNPRAALWIGSAGPLTQRSSVLRLLSKYALQADLPHICPHMLRHTFATRYLAANPDDIRGLAHLLGHTSLDTVMRYTTPSLADLCRRMERVDDQLLTEKTDG